MPQLVYSKSFNKNSFHLVELSNDDLVQAFESGSRLVIKGLPDDEAVLCTTSATYSVREVKTSNSLVLSTFDKDNHDTWRVVDDLSNTIEFLPCLARTNRINTLLHSTLYAGPSEEFKHQNKTMYTFSDLLSTVQASEQELIQGLKERNAFEIQGYYRLFERNYLHRLLDALVTQAIIQGHDVKEMSVKNAYECVREGLAAVEDEPTSVPDAVIMACIAAFADDDTDLTVATNSVHFNEKKICRFLGEVILASAKGKEWRLEDFMEVWRQVTPDVYQPQMEALQVSQKSP
ncbi:sister chromatid cohesion protein Dcc1 [Radiomyces spectabilis]|uniref:sister chromatid cohesion protein Dcc1 n=1 Tax=Radiomyces spectabilis TaxID=64574 RepID=UPI00221FF456|nr:sister chromatid cohesion protein Dcc1 [Radiomyces spectabilis]KAI8370706.1 sister chromatid cohesion protein Dcc1 [Radiomyces spectabilis]